MKQQPGKKTKVSPWDNLNAPEMFTAAFVLVFLGLVGFLLFDGLTSPMVLRDVAVELASDLRGAELQAKDQNEFITVKARPATWVSPAVFVGQGNKGFSWQKILPYGVSAAGILKLDAQGVPRLPVTFILRKGQHKVKLSVDPKGAVFVSQIDE